MAPVGSPDLPPAQSYFLAADGSGLGAVARYLEALPCYARGTVVVAAPPGIDLRAGYLPPTVLTVLHLPPDRFDACMVAVASRSTAARPPGFFLFAGEHRSARDLRQLAQRTLQLDRTRHGIVSYWRKPVCAAAETTCLQPSTSAGTGVIHAGIYSA